VVYARAEDTVDQLKIGDLQRILNSVEGYTRMAKSKKVKKKAAKGKATK
jgi:hypothetical protein